MTKTMASLLVSKRIIHLDVSRHSNHEEVQRENLEGLEGEGKPGAGDVRVPDVSDPVHGEGEDEHILNTDLCHQIVREEEEWDRN